MVPDTTENANIFQLLLRASNAESDLRDIVFTITMYVKQHRISKEEHGMVAKLDERISSLNAMTTAVLTGNVVKIDNSSSVKRKAPNWTESSVAKRPNASRQVFTQNYAGPSHSTLHDIDTDCQIDQLSTIKPDPDATSEHGDANVANNNKRIPFNNEQSETPVIPVDRTHNQVYTSDDDLEPTNSSNHFDSSAKEIQQDGSDSYSQHSTSPSSKQNENPELVRPKIASVSSLSNMEVDLGASESINSETTALDDTLEGGLLVPTKAEFIPNESTPALLQSRTPATTPITSFPVKAQQPSPFPASQKPPTTLPTASSSEMFPNDNDLVVYTTHADFSEMKTDQRKMLDIMLSMQQEMKFLRHRQERILEACSQRTDVPKSDDIVFPKACETMEEFRKMLKNAEEDDMFMRKMQTTLRQCGGEDVAVLVRRMWARVVTPEVQTKFNWTGLHEKEKIKDSAIFKIVFATAITVFPQCDKNEVEKITKKYFNNSHGRTKSSTSTLNTTNE